jgi:hypothetical protein
LIVEQMNDPDPGTAAHRDARSNAAGDGNAVKTVRLTQPAIAKLDKPADTHFAGPAWADSGVRSETSRLGKATPLQG